MNTPHQVGLIDGFVPLKTNHCVTGSMRNIFQFNHYPVSEDLLLGIGAGVGFIYWQTKGMAPFLGGRANVGRPGEDGLEITTSKRLGVACDRHMTSSGKKAEKRLIDLLLSEIPVMLYVDMGFLPYLHLPEGMHFGAHMVVAAGYNPSTSEILIADRDGKVHPISMIDLYEARNSKFKPFPPKNAWFEFDFSKAKKPEGDVILQAIFEASHQMINPLISNIGVKGIKKAARRVAEWSKTMDEDILREACINGYIYIDATGGTGGGLFRYMYGRFLGEAAEYTGMKSLEALGGEFKKIGDHWQGVALSFKEAYESADPLRYLENISSKLQMIAELEDMVWQNLFKICHQ